MGCLGARSPVRLFFCRSAWLDKTQAGRVESGRDHLALEMSDLAGNDQKKGDFENRATSIEDF